MLSSACKKDKEMVTCEAEIITVHPVLFNGVSYESPPTQVDSETFDSVDEIGANAVSIIPFGFISNESSTVSYSIGGQWWGETDAGVIDLIRFAQEHNKKTILKPQVWIWGGQFTGDYEASSEAEWVNMENSYIDFILHYADIADSMKCELFCIGTELKKFHQTRPLFWGQMIDSIRVHYSGEFTYAGNWDSYSTFSHWDKLDYIGIDAYFPVSDDQTPSKEDCVEGWEVWFNSIKSHQEELDLPVIFTEYGYRSVDFGAREPWDSSTSGTTNMEAQVNSYAAIFEKFWSEEWFEGGFLWKWKANHSSVGGLQNNQFTPQNKPVEETIKSIYLR